MQNIIVPKPHTGREIAFSVVVALWRLPGQLRTDIFTTCTSIVRINTADFFYTIRDDEIVRRVTQLYFPHDIQLIKLADCRHESGVFFITEHFIILATHNSWSSEILAWKPYTMEITILHMFKTLWFVFW